MTRSVLILVVTAVVAGLLLVPATKWERWQAAIDRKDVSALQQKSESLRAGMTEGTVVYTLGLPRSVSPGRYAELMAGTNFWTYEGPDIGVTLIVGFDQGRVTAVNFLVVEDRCGPYYWYSVCEYWKRHARKFHPPTLASR